MCSMNAGTAGSVVLAQNAYATALLDRFAAAPGHTLVVLRTHEEDLTRLPWEQWSALQKLAWEASRALMATLAPRRVWVAALGSPEAIPTSFPHVHVHVLPIAEAGESARPARVLSWSEGVWVYEDGEAEALGQRLKARW